MCVCVCACSETEKPQVRTERTTELVHCSHPPRVTIVKNLPIYATKISSEPSKESEKSLKVLPNVKCCLPDTLENGEEREINTVRSNRSRQKKDVL